LTYIESKSYVLLKYIDELQFHVTAIETGFIQRPDVLRPLGLSRKLVIGLLMCFISNPHRVLWKALLGRHELF